MSLETEQGTPIITPVRRARRTGLIACATIFGMVAAIFTAWAISLGPLPLREAREVSTTIVDRHGKLLRAYAMTDGRWRLPVHAATDVDPTYM